MYRTPLDHINEITRRFELNARGRYMPGQEDHGGRLWLKPVLGQLKAELIDALIYFDTHEEQQSRVVSLLADAQHDKDWGKVFLAYRLLVYGNEDGVMEEDRP